MIGVTMVLKKLRILTHHLAFGRYFSSDEEVLMILTINDLLIIDQGPLRF
jgi:hypothetical protein